MEVDERILKLKNDAKKAEKNAHEENIIHQEIKQSIYDKKINIFGYATVFVDRKLLDGKISIRIPDDFVPLEDDVVHVLYPLGNRPQFVMGNEPFYFMLGFNHTQHRIPENQIKEFPILAKAMLEKCGPKVTILKTECIRCGEREVSTMSFVSQTLQGALYNMMFYSNVSGRLLIGFINFRYEDHKRLEPLAKEIIESYRILETNGEEIS